MKYNKEKMFYNVDSFGFECSKLKGRYSTELILQKNFDENELKKFIFNRIKEDIDLTRFPTTCVIAGGYLLGLTMEFFGWSPAKNSDIDIFQFFYGESDEDRKDEDFKKFLNEEEDLYKFYIKSNNYEILGTSRKGNLNTTKITVSNNFNWKDLIKDFDINAIKIGAKIDNNSWELFISDEFIDFLNTKELFPLINGYYEDGVFLRTFARLLIKKEQYPFLKLQDFFIYQMAIIFETTWFNSTEVSIKNIGKEKIAILEKYFENNPCIEVKDSVFKILNKEVYKIKEYNDEIIDYLISKKRAFLSKAEINRIIKLEKFEWFKERKFRGSILREIYFKLGLFEKDYSLRDLNILSKIFSHERKSFQLNIGRSIKNLEGEVLLLFFDFLNKNQEFIGLLEVMSIKYQEELRSIKNINDLKKLKKKVEKEEFQWNFSPLEDLFIYSKYIRELTSQEMLNTESSIMKHCVKGYWSSIASGKERIFHLNYNGNPSTFSVKKDCFGNLYCSQHSSIRNEKPAKSNELIKNLFINYLSKSNFGNILKSDSSNSSCFRIHDNQILL